MTQAKEVIINANRGSSLEGLAEVWHHRELLGFFLWRDISVRYKQSLLGITWTVLTPTATMLVFTVVFSKMAGISTGEIPYPLFCFTGILPWTFFSKSLQRATSSMVSERSVLTKVYFPRLIVPLSASLASLVDFMIAGVALLGIMAFYRVTPSAYGLCSIPLVVFWAWLGAIGVGLWLGALNVYFRDVAQVTPFLLMVWMYATPIVYPSSLVPKSLQWLVTLNPMSGVIQGFRWALLRTDAPPGAVLAASFIATLLLFASGIIFFRRMENNFADVV